MPEAMLRGDSVLYLLFGGLAVLLAAASAIGTVMQPGTYKVYGRFEGPLGAHANFFAEAAWAVLSVKEA